MEWRLLSSDEDVTFEPDRVVQAIQRRLPEQVGVGLCLAEAGAPSLMPEERRLLSERAVPSRRLQFALGRGAARKALSRLGLPASVIGRGPAGEPVWPDGIVGSITHSAEAGLALAGYSSRLVGLGVDLEPLTRDVLSDITGYVCLPAELTWVNEAASEDGRRARLLMTFSAKEAIYKALYPTARVVLDFHDVSLSWLPGHEEFHGVLMRSAGPWPQGYAIRGHRPPLEGQIVTLVALEKPRTG